MLSQEELIEVLRRIADSSLQQSASNNRLATAVDKLIPSFEQIRRDLYDVKTDRENDVRMYQQTMANAFAEIQQKLVLLLDTRDDVKQLSKDITGAFKIPEDKRTPVERIIDRFESLKTSTKILIAILVVIAGMSGWLTHWLAG
jgi:hypothetical protein